MTTHALVVLAPGFEEIEAVTPIDVLRRAGVSVTVAGLSSLHVTGSHGIILTADILLSDVSAEYDALVLPGGQPGADNLAASAVLKERILRMHSRGKTIAAICAAPAVVLSPLGILTGKKATGFPGMEDEFAAGITLVDAPVVVDGNIITSRGAGTAMEFALALVKTLTGTPQTEALRKKMVVPDYLTSWAQ
jgi:protein deglycase